MTIKICDRCGARICSEESKVKMTQIIINPKSDIHEIWDVLDLCDECKSSFNEWMHHYDDHSEERKMPISRNCLEGYLTEGCENCPDWSDGTDGRGIGCCTDKPIDECPYFHAMWEKDNKKHRLDVLKEERDQIKQMKCLSFDVRDQVIKYYDHEIMCIEEYGSDNPIVD